MKVFDSEFANVKWMEEDNVVFLIWKKEAHLLDYRRPAEFALGLLREHTGSQLVVDARNGFEDDKRDVEWGLQYLLSGMAETSCRFVSFIMNEVNEIEEEMSMWTVEFGKYFAVTRAVDYQSALRSIKEYILTTVTYVVKEGKRDEFVQDLIEQKVMESSRKEPGNIRYEVSLPIEASNEIRLLEMWTNTQEAIRHKKTEHYQLLSKMKLQYVTDVRIQSYAINQI